MGKLDKIPGLPRRLVLALCWLSVVLLATGCASPQAAKRFAAFSSATSETAGSTINAFETVERTYYEAQVAALVVNYKAKGFRPGSIQRFLSAEDLEARRKVLDGVRQYAQKLAEIMGDKQLNEFDDQTKAFGQSLVELKDNPAFQKIGEGISGANLNAFTTAVNAMGRWFIDYKRQKEVPKIVSEMQPHVRQVCDLLIQDIGQVADENGRGGRGLRDQLWIQYEQIVRAQDTFIRQNYDQLDPQTRAEEIKKLPLLIAEQRRADATLKATQEALRQLSKTHDELDKAFEKSAPALDQLVRELVAEGQRVKRFYQSLEKN